MDVKAAVDGGFALFSDLARMLPGLNGALAFAAVCIVAAFALTKSSIGKRARVGLEETVFSNWQLALLGATGVILSLASGYTTWDGMRNFTGEAVLSGMVTFGIQGVMLIVAWLIGESFATGMNQVAHGDGGGQSHKGWAADRIIGLALGAALVGVTFYALVRTYGVTSNGHFDARNFSNVAMYFAFALILLAILFLNRKGDLALPYVQSTRVVIKNAVLWVMFLACMTTSVFFSFDSLFSAIFPQTERQRAAEIRSVNQVAGTVADIGELIEKRRIEQAQALFTLPAWNSYETELDKAAQLAAVAPDKIREQITRELEAQKSRIAKLEEQKASAQSNQAGLVSRKQLLTDNVSRLEAERPEAAQKFNEQKAVVADVEKRLDEARAKVLAEEKGVEGSGKVGKGQFYRAAVGEVDKIQSELQVARERLKGHETRLTAVSRGISVAKAELAQIDGSLANLKGEADTAAQMIVVAQSGAKSNINEQLDPSALAASLERDRQQFRQKPEQKTLSALQNDCLALQAVSLKVASLQPSAAAIDCDPKQASEAAARVFALNAGIENFATACAGGDKIADKKTTDDLLGFGRKCLSDSGLPSKDTAEIAGKLSAIDLSRDDKAHRFVVTLNAFQDGNRLAYLALAIAIAIDSLVFMSGLFGANAVRSPLSDMPSMKARSASQLEGIIANALLPDTYETARAALSAMRPITPVDGYTKEVWMPNDGTVNPHVMGVLNAGAAIGAVKRDPNRAEHYLVRGELFEFLSVTAKKAFDADKEKPRLADLERTIGVALLRNVPLNVAIVQDALHPMNEDRGFSAEIRLKEAHPQDAPIIRKVLNAGASFGVVQRVGTDATHFYIHRDLVRTLSNIQARLMMSGAYANLQDDGMRPGQIRHAGAMREQQAAIGSMAAAPQIAAPQPPRALTEDEIRQHDIDNLLRAIGLAPELYAVAAGLGAGATVGAATAFAVVRARNGALDRHVGERDGAAQKAFFDAYAAIRSGIRDDDERRIDILNEAHEELASKWPTLMLMPDGPYESLIEDLISRLEPQAGAGKLAPTERDLFRLLKTLKGQLAASGRSTADEWQRLERAFQIDAAADPNGNLVVLEQSNARAGQR